MTKTFLTLLALIIAGAAVLPAAASCAGSCVTTEYRIDEFVDHWNTNYSRTFNGSKLEAWNKVTNYYVPAKDQDAETAVLGVRLPQETKGIKQIRSWAAEAAKICRDEARANYDALAATAGTTNTCSTGCICNEGKFVETASNFSPIIADAGTRTIENGTKSFTYYYSWSGSASLDFTQRTKTVDCVALEP